MDPLVRFKEAHSKGIIPDDVFELTVKRFPIVIAGINRIEKVPQRAMRAGFVFAHQSAIADDVSVQYRR